MAKINISREFLHDQYFIKMKSLSEIARSIGVGEWTVRRRAIEHGFEIRKVDPRARNRDWLICKYDTENNTVEQICEILKCSRPTIVASMQKFGIKARRTGPLSGHKFSEEHNRRMAAKSALHRHSMETRIVLSTYRGERASNWKGGTTKLSRLLRNSLDGKIWKSEVFKRDGKKCSICKTEQGPFQVDHIKPWSKYPELRFSISNGRVLCVPCHKNTPTYGNSYPEKQLVLQIHSKVCP